MPESLSGKVVIVVGASSGMGRATAVAAARSGAQVMAAARRETALLELQQELAAEGLPLAVQATDASRRDAVEALIAATLQKFSRVDALVYATGTNLPDRSLTRLTPANWDTLLATNLTGAFHCTQCVLPALRQTAGLIVYLSSAAVQMPDVSGVAYQATKHGLAGLAHGTRVEEKAHGIRTTVIYPGLCDTEILLKRPVPTPREVVDKALQPGDVAEAVLFLLRLPARAVVPEMQLLPSRL